MKKLVIVFILLISSNIAFAQNSTAKFFLTDGQTINGETIDATGFQHGYEMNVPGTAYLTNVTVTNAGTDYVTQDGRHGTGRGIVATGVGAHIIVNGGSSMYNSEEGFRAIQGGKLTIVNAEASHNGKAGFFAGVGSTMEVTEGTAVGNIYGVLGGSGFIEIDVNGGTYSENTGQGMHIIEGGILYVDSANIQSNGTAGESSVDFGGIGIFGVEHVKITDTIISDNLNDGVLAESNTAYQDPPVQVIMERVEITNNGTVAVRSIGDSMVIIASSQLAGTCLREADLNGGKSSGSIFGHNNAVTPTPPRTPLAFAQVAPPSPTAFVPPAPTPDIYCPE